MSHAVKPFVNRRRLEERIAELHLEAEKLPTQGDAEPEDVQPRERGELAMAWYLEGYRRGILCALADIEECL